MLSCFLSNILRHPNSVKWLAWGTILWLVHLCSNSVIWLVRDTYSTWYANREFFCHSVNMITQKLWDFLPKPFSHTLSWDFPPKKHACLGLGLCQNVVFGHEKCFFNSVSEVSRNIIYEQRLLYIAQKSISFDDIVFFLAASHARPMFYLLFHTYNAVFCHSYVVQFSFSIERWEGKL